MSFILAMKRAATMRCEPEILEIRIHGVQNTPPAEMLETQPENVRRRLGDDLGSFWHRVKDVPQPGISETEAFSWGAQARTGGGALAATGRAIVHVGWFLLLPFALANLAYWTRLIGKQEAAGSKSWDGAAGAATVRIFGLLLTLIAVAAFSSVAVDLVAIQCFKDGTQVCAALPSVFDGLRELDRDSRAALLGIVPIATIVVLYVIGRGGRVHFEERVKAFGKDLGNEDETEPGKPLLATRGFWAISRVGQTSEWLHVAASVTLVLMLLALDAAYVNVKDCFRSTNQTITEACVTAGWNNPLAAWFVIGSLALMIVIVVLVALASHTPKRSNRLAEFLVLRSQSKALATARPTDGSVGTGEANDDAPTSAEIRTSWKRGFAMACLVLSIAGYVAWIGLAFSRETAENGDERPGFMGLIVTPIVLVVLAIFLALAGVGWRALSHQMLWRWVSGVLLAAGAASLLLSHMDFFGDALPWNWLFVAIAVSCIVLHLVIAWATSGDNRYQAWRGQGAAVVMILALFASMALSSLLVLGAASWIGRPVEKDPEEGIYRSPGDPLPDTVWNTPDAYERFAVLLTVITVLMILLVLAAVAANLLRFVRFSLPSLDPVDDYAVADIDYGGVDQPDRTYPPRVRFPEGQTRRRVMVRRSSHMLHRGEPLFGWLAVFAGVGFLSLASTTVYEAAKLWVSELCDDCAGLPSDIRLASTAVLVAVALAAVAAVATQAAASADRPLGVFWDVVAFFPRAGHPLAPPCYGERVVPELSARTKLWMNDKAATRPRAVIFTAHSMGSTISAATLFALRGEKIEAAGPLKDTEVTARIALLSYGSQLRSYFSRFFPSVFGPAVLGIPGVRGPSLWHGDPWRNQLRDEYDLWDERHKVREAERVKQRAEQSAKQKAKQIAKLQAKLEASTATHATEAKLARLEAKLRAAQQSGVPLTLTAILGADDGPPHRRVPRWRSLWRRTDYLGFPVYGYRSDPNPVDRGATETAPATYLWRVADHSNYLGTPQILRARDELVAELRHTSRSDGRTDRSD